MGCGQRSFKLVWRCQLLSGLLTKEHLPQASRQSANDKANNEMIPKAVHRSPGIYLMAEDNPEKPQLEDRPMKPV